MNIVYKVTCPKCKALNEIKDSITPANVEGDGEEYLIVNNMIFGGQSPELKRCQYCSHVFAVLVAGLMRITVKVLELTPVEKE